MASSLNFQFKAGGKTGIPRQIDLGGQTYQREKVFKHDFFAGTALYIKDSDAKGGPDKIILKLGRTGDFLGVPLSWAGRMLIEHEYNLLMMLQGIKNVPQLIGKYGRSGFVYEYIQGCSLDEKPDLSDEFFFRLNEIVSAIHQKNIAYIDLNKRGNILLGMDGQPYLIDFQVSQYIEWPKPFAGFGRFILKCLQEEDSYHINKHKRHLARHLMSDAEITASRQKSSLVKLHRFLFRPLIVGRRCILAYLFQQGHLRTDDVEHEVPENDPGRWIKKRKRHIKKTG